MRVTIDREQCISCGVCWETCPDVFEQNEEDAFSQIVETLRVGGSLAIGGVPEDLEECAREAAEGCPVEIIHAE